MKVNGLDIASYGATLISYEVSAAELDKTVEWGGGSLTPFIHFKTNKHKELKVKVLLEGATRDTVEKNKSNLAKALQQCQVEFEDAVFIYDGVLEDISFTNINRLAITAEISLKVIAQEAQKTITLSKLSSQTVSIDGNSSCEVIYEITPSAAMSSFTINGITINNLDANKTVIVNGVKKTVTVDGVNKFKDTDFWEFPKLNVGSNIIAMSATTVEVKIKYNPKWN